MKFYEREYVTALPNPMYNVTNDGWTGKVRSYRVSCDDHYMDVEARDKSGHLYSRGFWIVDTDVFIPYSENMETCNFPNFYIADGGGT